MNDIKIGYQGVPGSFSQQALSEYFGLEVLESHYPDFEDILIQLSNATIDYGILPIENSSTGGISETYRLLRDYSCFIVGERCIKVEHHLVGLFDSKLEDISQVYSHPQAYEQSSRFFKDYPKMHFVPFKNTAKSAKYISELKDTHNGAICSRKAAYIYGLKILAENINYNYKNYTRFAILSKNIEIKPECNKISIVLTVPHTPGSLYKTLRYFEENHLNLTKIESRPLLDKPWQYYFYLDIEGNLNDPIVKNALKQVKDNSSYFKIFGNYCSHNIK